MKFLPEPPAVVAPRPLPAFLYHGTSTLYLEQILADGLQPCCLTGAVPMCCYADEPAIAIHHAVEMADWEASDPVLFRISTGRFHPTLFVLDDRFVDLAPSSGRGTHAYRMAGHRRWKRLPWTWRTMLSVAGAVGYTGTVAVSRADLVRGIEWPLPGGTDQVSGSARLVPVSAAA